MFIGQGKVTSSGINPLSAASASLSVYPNPSDGVIHCDLNLQSSSEVSVEVFDLLGKRVHSANLGNTTSRQFEIDLSREYPGIYFISVKSGSESLTRKINLVK